MWYCTNIWNKHSGIGRKGNWLFRLCSASKATFVEAVSKTRDRIKGMKNRGKRDRGGGQKDKEPASGRGGEIQHETSRLLENKQEGRRWIAAPLHTDAWWMGLLPEKPEQGTTREVCLLIPLCGCMWNPAEWSIWAMTTLEGRLGSLHPPRTKTYPQSPPTGAQGQLSNPTAGN